MKIAYLGPKGTFSEAALINLLGSKEFEAQLVTHLGELFLELENKTIDYAWLPLWNSGCGFLTDEQQQEFLTIMQNAKNDYVICAESFMPLDFALLTMPGVNMEDIKTIYVNPYACELCKTFFHQHSHLKIVTKGSSSAAAKALAQEQDRTIAATASLETGTLYGLVALKNNMLAENEHALMQFILFGLNKTSKPLEENTERLITSCIIKAVDIHSILSNSLYRPIAIRKSTQSPTHYLVDFQNAIQSNKLENIFGKALIHTFGTYPAAKNRWQWNDATL